MKMSKWLQLLTTVLYCCRSSSCTFTAQPCVLLTKSLQTVKACSVNSGLKTFGFCLLCLDLTPLWHGHEHCGIETIWSGKTDRGQETEIRNRTAKTDAVGGVNPVCEWVIMSIHPAVAPSGATGLARSLMRRHRRLLQQRSLTRQFLSACGKADQVRGGR